MVCLNKKGLTTGTIVMLILILVSFLVLVVFVRDIVVLLVKLEIDGCVN